MTLPKFKLCCGGRGCPEVTITKNGCKIKDDKGQTVTLTKAEIIEFVERIQCFFASPPLPD